MVEMLELNPVLGFPKAAIDRPSTSLWWQRRDSNPQFLAPKASGISRYPTPPNFASTISFSVADRFAVQLEPARQLPGAVPAERSIVQSSPESSRSRIRKTTSATSSDYGDHQKLVEYSASTSNQNSSYLVHQSPSM